MSVPSTARAPSESDPLEGADLPRHPRRYKSIALRTQHPDDARAIRSAHPNMSGVFSRVLAARGYTADEPLRELLEPRLAALLHPGAMKNFNFAAERIAEALRSREPMVNGTDYDMDGVTAGAELRDLAIRFGGILRTAIPHRQRHGYGAHEFMLEECSKIGARLLILSDIGTSNVEFAAEAKRKKIELIVFDHHRPGKELPECVLVNPLQEGDESGLTMLSGAGLMWHAVARAGRLLDPHFDPRGALDLCTLGTIADLVPLKGQNRILVHHGLPLLSDSPREGIKELKRVMKRGDTLSVGDVGFYLAPAGNASGRLDDAAATFRLLTTADPQEAARLASEIRRFNDARRALEEQLTAKAHAKVQRLSDLPAGLVLEDQAFHPGIIGLIASRIAEYYHRPTLVFGRDGEIDKGSARAGNPEFDVGLALMRLNELFLKQGGHTGAGGCSAVRANLGRIRRGWAVEAERQLAEKEQRAFAAADVEVGLRTIDADLIAELSTLGPFGMGNPEPVLLLRGLKISGLRELGDREHLSMTLADGAGLERRAVLWRHGLHPAVQDGALVDVAAKATRHYFAGKNTVQLELAAVEPAREGRYGPPPR